MQLRCEEPAFQKLAEHLHSPGIQYLFHSGLSIQTSWTPMQKVMPGSVGSPPGYLEWDPDFERQLPAPNQVRNISFSKDRTFASVVWFTSTGQWHRQTWRCYLKVPASKSDLLVLAFRSLWMAEFWAAWPATDMDTWQSDREVSQVVRVPSYRCNILR